MKRILFAIFCLLSFQSVAQVDRIELGIQTTRRGVVWYQDTLPRHKPNWRLSRDTNAVLWVDTTTAIRYDWDYKNDRWRAKGTYKDSLPPLPQYYYTIDSTVIDYTTLWWIRDTFNILHKYDSTCQAWTPIGDFIFGDTVPSNIAPTDSNGAAIYTRSLWQNDSTFVVKYWNGAIWKSFDDGIYGDGSPGSGSDTLPPGGSNVTIPGPWQGLSFSINNTAGSWWHALTVVSAYCDDDAFVDILKHKTPVDSFVIQDFDCETFLKQYNRSLHLEAGLDLFHQAGAWMDLSADSVSIGTILPVSQIPWVIGQGAPGTNPNTLRRIQGTASGQVLKWNGTNWALAQDSIGGGGGGPSVDGAENGLYLSGTKVRLGTNPLIEQTQIDQAGFRMIWNNGKWSYSSQAFNTYNPTQPFGLSGAESLPTIGAPVVDGILELRPHLGNGMEENTLVFGGYPTDNVGMWMQSRGASQYNTYYGLNLQPRGGNWAVGRNNLTQAKGTVSAVGLSGTTASGVVLLLENSEGSGLTKLGFGTGADNLGAEVSWNSPTSSMRITNRNTVAGTSSVRVALGAQDEDVAVLLKSAATSKVRASFGQTTPAQIHSTLQSGGSLATAFTQTTGNFTINETHHTVVYTLNSTVNWTLPDPTTCIGRQYILHHFGSTGNIGLNYNVVSSSGTTFNAVPARNWAWIISDGTNWRGYRLTSQ